MILAGGSPLMTDPNLHHILWQPPEEVYERLAAHLPRTGTENVAVRLLPWTRLLDSMYDPLSRSFGVVLEAGPGAGKTTLLDNFVERFPQFDCVKISFNDPYTTAAELFRCHGVDAEQKRADIPTDVIRVMLVDDVAFKFHEKAFWNDLILMYIPPNLRFVFAGTYSVICREPQLLKKASWWHQLWRRDFSLSDDEARAVLQLPSGLPASLQTPMLMQVMIRDCKGHLNTLRMACDLMRAKFGSSRPRWSYTISRGR